MATTLRASVFALLQADTTLRSLLSKAADPYGIYFLHPPKTPVFPVVTFAELAASGDFPRVGSFQTTAWHGDRDAILRQIYATLHNATITATDFGHVKILFDWMGPDLLDATWHVYFRQSRWLYQAIKL
jgi:hypothetical protein